LGIGNNPTFVGNGGTGTASASLQVTGGASNQLANLQFRSTFGNFPQDTGPRRTADIWAWFNGGAWTTETLSFGVGTGGGNDADALTTERMRITGDGQVTMPYQPAFLVSRTAGDLAGANVDIVWNSVTTNVGGRYNSSNGVFTAPVTGRYFFGASAMRSGGSGVIWLELLKNGTRVGSVNPYSEASGNYAHVGFSAVVELAANDAVKVRLGNNANNSMYGVGNAHNSFTGYLLG
jgi:hypothetical protein